MGGSGPHQRSTGAVVVLDEVLDLGDEVADTRKRAAPDSLLGYKQRELLPR